MNMANWFAPKRYGCGSGLPISWQGWVVTMAYVAMAAGGGLLAKRSPIAGLSIILPATILFMIICFKTTAGGWRCRWGSKE
jgi:hypothetical protein